ncbi:unnamed protein product [Citrullus colocynthis]|uniref:Uncharacterized protein n=1 Tax=Citrullus colocynthis TaxID=252529 RepID=A0ABP0YKZ2_9ROSI
MMYAYTSSVSCMVIACAIQYLPFYLFILLRYFITSPLYSHLRLPQLLVIKDKVLEKDTKEILAQKKNIPESDRTFSGFF